MTQEELLKIYDQLDLEKLPAYLRKNDFGYYLIKRTNEKCIYERRDDKKNETYSYEVFRTHIKKFREPFRKRFPDKFIMLKEYKEYFPSDEDFGKRAWNFQTLERALQFFESI